MSEEVSLPSKKDELKMATSQPGELKEFEKLDSLLSQIPKKAQHGLLMSCDLILTCIDANSLYIALGTNIGVTFLYSRTDHSMQRLKSASTNDVITCIRLHHGIDDQLAVATASGGLSIYFIPGTASMHKRQLEKFEVRDMHKHFITCLEWSTNGMKLYSGDKNGQVANTEVDFYEGQCKSSLLLVETATEIIQLDYKHKLLLVSTRKRSFIVRVDQKCQVITVGTKDRKIPGPFGACILPGMCKPEDAKLYAARPGCRLWLSDVNGVVINTYIFTDPLSAAVPEIPLLSAGKLQTAQSEFQFGVLKCFRGREIVTWSSSALIVLDPEANRVVACQGRLNGIVDVAVVDDTDEIFLLRRHADARVIRIAATALEIKPAPAEILPVMVSVKSEAKEEKEKDNPAQSFFKKLTKPLKNLDRNILHEIKQESKVPESARPSAVISPDLPPVVRLSSPELEGVRVYTGGSVDTQVTVAADLSTGLASTELEVVPVYTGGTLDTQVAGQCVVTSASLSIVSTTNATGPSVPVPNTAAVSSCPEGHQDKGENIPPEEDNIVFTHKVKKHKKKKVKEGLLAPKNKEDDSISLKSASSQHSDDGRSTSTSSNVQYTSDTTVNTLQCADDMIKLVNTLMNSGNDPTNGLVPSEADRGGFQVADFTLLAQTTTDKSPQTAVATNEKSQTALIRTDMSHTAVATNEKTQTSVGDRISSVISSNGELIDTLDSLVSSGKSVPDDKSIVPVYDSTGKSENLRASLSECDQHLEIAKELHAITADGSDKQNLAQDVSTILNNAMANLAISKATTVEMVSHDIEHSRSDSHLSSVTSTSSRQVSFQDIYSEIEVIESTDPFHKGYRRENSADDFYSPFLDISPESPVYPVEKPALPALQATMPVPSEAECRTEMQDVAERRLANTFSEFTTPANIYSLALSNSHVWFTDKSENIYYSSVGTPKGIQWRKATGHGKQISVSPSGHIIWRLHRGVVYAGTKISTRHPEGLKWVEAVRDVATISVDNDCAWFVMHNGDVMMQRKLSSERPCYKSHKVECPHRLKHIVVQRGVVWAITDSLGLVVRTGVSDEEPEGVGWQLDNRDVPPYLFSHVALDSENIGWAIDILGQIWFCDGVSRAQPLGRRQWWQVPLSEYILHDETTLDIIRGLARMFDPKKLSYILSTNRGGLITAGSHGVWLALNFRNVLQVCQGNVQGYHWIQAQPAQMSPSSTWRQVCAEVSHLDWGLVWAQHTNGDIFTFKRARAEASMIPDCSDFYCIAVGPTATWALTSNGAIFVRTGMGPECPQGTEWVELDISQLGDAHVVHISCNSLYVWAVDAEGTVYHRIGAKPPSADNLSPAWLPIETFYTTIFTRVHTGPLDWMVWATDNCRLTYVRAGITENMPIGQEWVNVPGIQAMDLALTKTGVWALTPNGEIFFRYGIARDRPCGNYWKKIPGSFIKISASANDELWGINLEGQLMQCSVRCLPRHEDTSDNIQPSTGSTRNSVSDDVDWEIV